MQTIDRTMHLSFSFSSFLYLYHDYKLWHVAVNTNAPVKNVLSSDEEKKSRARLDS